MTFYQHIGSCIVEKWTNNNLVCKRVQKRGNAGVLNVSYTLFYLRKWVKFSGYAWKFHIVTTYWWVWNNFKTVGSVIVVLDNNMMVRNSLIFSHWLMRRWLSTPKKDANIQLFNVSFLLLCILTELVWSGCTSSTTKPCKFSVFHCSTYWNVFNFY